MSTHVSLCALLALLLWPASQFASQNIRAPDREDRVVIHSPHFDEPDPQQGPLGCAAMPLKLFGFETRSVRSDTAVRLQVRVFHTERSEQGRVQHVPLPGAQVELTHRMVGESGEALPTTREFVGVADTGGSLELNVRPGVYRIRILMIGYRGGEGVIRFRPSARDSLHAYLDTMAICPP